MITAKPKAVPERKATGRTERLFHDIKQVLRLTGVPQCFCAYAAQEGVLAALWEGARPSAETCAFEDAADRLREEAVLAAAGMERLSVLGLAQLGESQAFQAERALLLWHYANPKLLLLSALLRQALEGAPPAERGRQPGSCDLLERGAPESMPPMEYVEEGLEDEEVRRVYRDVRRSTGVERVGTDLRALALWPRYLEGAWLRLKPAMKTDGYRATRERLLALARELSSALPYPARLSADALGREGGDVAAAAALTRELEESLPGRVLDTALLALDWRAPEAARRSPFPARSGAGQEEL